jgi:hypothetical protein
MKRAKLVQISHAILQGNFASSLSDIVRCDPDAVFGPALVTELSRDELFGH